MMSSTQAQYRPMPLSSLSSALAPFPTSYECMLRVIKVFEDILRNVYHYHLQDFTSTFSSNPLPATSYQEHIHEPWQSWPADLRDYTSDIYADPESIQVAQALARLDPVRIWFELYEQLAVGNIVGAPWIAVEQVYGTWSHGVRLGQKWLANCGIVGLATIVASSISNSDPSTARPSFNESQQNLHAVASCGPKYGVAERPENESALLDVFGPAGVLWKVLELVTFWLNDARGVDVVLGVLVQLAMDIAAIYRDSWQCSDRRACIPQAYKWYAYGLMEARRKFIMLVESRDPKNVLPSCVRNALTAVNFVNLWDGIWCYANGMLRYSGAGAVSMHQNLLLWIYFNTTRAPSDLRPCMPLDNVRMLTEKYFVLHCGMRLEPGTPIEAVESILPNYVQGVDTQRIAILEPPEFLLTDWGTRFYEFSYVEDSLDAGEIPAEMDVNETADVEAVGPAIEPPLAAEVTTLEPEEQQNSCTICMEGHSYNHGDGRTLKLNACGHYFHRECIYGWLNGSSLNRNLCPECRAQFSVQLRQVRPVGMAS